MMRRIGSTALASLALTFGLFIVAPVIASAHVLKQDNGIAVVLHIPPDDNPMSNQTTVLEFAFASSGDTFRLADCHCQVAVVSQGKTIQAVAIYAVSSNDQLDGVAKVHFPAAGIYNLIVTGQSTKQTFTNFQLNYLERVTSPYTTGGRQNASNVIIISAGSLVVLTMLAYNAIQQGGRYKEPKKGARKL